MKLKLSSFIGISAFLFVFTIPAAQASQPPCPSYKLVGKWSYSEQGNYSSTHAMFPSAAFSEVGWFELHRNETGIAGAGEVHLSINGTAIPKAGNPGIPITIDDVYMNEDTCIGNATFTPFGSDERTITFVYNDRAKEFQYISTAEDLTILGMGKKQRGQWGDWYDYD